MFGILDKVGGLRINTVDPAIFKVIDEIKSDAAADMRKYDEMTADPTFTKEQRRFIQNTRESYEATTAAGYTFVALAYLKNAVIDAPDNLDSLTGTLLQGIENAARNNALTRASIRAISEDVKKLVSDGRLRLNGRDAAPLASVNADFFDDGFSFTWVDQYSKAVDSFSKYGKGLIERASAALNRKGLTPEQCVYLEYEKQDLIISLKELYRSVKFLPFGKPISLDGALMLLDDVLKTSVVLETSASERLDVALVLVKSLADRSVLTVDNTNNREELRC